MMERCRYTWGLVMDGSAEGMKNNQDRAGIVLFYDEFFFRLFKRAKVFLDIFPDAAKRGEVRELLHDLLAPTPCCHTYEYGSVLLLPTTATDSNEGHGAYAKDRRR
jgi:hypothetical protein